MTNCWISLVPSKIVRIIENLSGGDLILDGEVLGLVEDESPRRFQDTMGDFGADEGAARGPVSGPSSSTSC